MMNLANVSDFGAFVKAFAQEYRTANTPENDDPVGDFDLLLFGLVPQHPSFSTKNFPGLETRRKRGFSRRAAREKFPDWLARNFGEFATILAPGWSAEAWGSLFGEVLTVKYGGERVRIPKKPADPIKLAARTMTVKQLMEHFGISRSYAYRLVGQKRKKSTF